MDAPTAGGAPGAVADEAGTQGTETVPVDAVVEETVIDETVVEDPAMFIGTGGAATPWTGWANAAAGHNAHPASRILIALFMRPPFFKVCGGGREAASGPASSSHDAPAGKDLRDESLDAEIRGLIRASLLPKTKARIPVLDRMLEDATSGKQ